MPAPFPSTGVVSLARDWLSPVTDCHFVCVLTQAAPL